MKVETLKALRRWIATTGGPWSSDLVAALDAEIAEVEPPVPCELGDVKHRFTCTKPNQHGEPKP